MTPLMKTLCTVLAALALAAPAPADEKIYAATLPATAWVAAQGGKHTLYHHLKSTLEVYDAQLGLRQQQQMEPSPN
jgi:hypothetical protein